MGNRSQNRFGRPNEDPYRRQRLQKEKEKRDIEKPFCCLGCNFRGTEEQAKIHEEKMQIQLDNMMHNKVNIIRLQEDMREARENIEKLKDKIREANGG